MAPPCLPVDVVPSFHKAARRLFLTATLADDNVLVTDFGADPVSVSKPIVPKSASDLGDRLILSPFEAEPGQDHAALRAFLADLAKTHNTVVITPSDKRALVWSDVANRVCSKDSIAETVDELQRNHIGLVVFANRYDGIDLPGDACRVLVIDGLPTFANPLERLDAAMVDGTESIARELMQRVEQGMGRGVRSNEDHCVVVLSDLSLAREVWTYGDRFFSPATAAQLGLSRQVAGQLRGTDLLELRSAIDLVLGRDPTWVAASRAALAPIESKTISEISEIAIAQRKSFELAQDARHSEAVASMRTVIDTIEERPVRGWAKQLAAHYLYQYDRVSADELQKSAREDNRSAFRPIGSHLSPTLLKTTLSQSQASASQLQNRYGSPADALLGVEELVSRLRPDPEETKDFERAVEELGLLLGFGAQRPEQEYGAGPDVLWALGDLSFLVIECKSGSVSDSIHKAELAQLGHSADWFASKYDATCTATPVLIHPSRQCGRAAVAAAGTKVITFDRLAELLGRVREFAAAVAADSTFEAEAVGKRLMALELNASGFASRWSQSVKPARS
ncbi:MAG: hypothetical protein CL424_14735 [Acidimicrobiaceae bacterium]|nr:hypothetical protein [Acidimicrobiaceae bacterium]